MINWRSLVLAAHPGISTVTGMLLTQTLSAATVLSVILACRGVWRPQAPIFPVQFTLVTLATVLVTHHSFTYGAVMLVLPVAAVFSEGLATPWTRWSVLSGTVLPTLSFTLWKFLSVPHAARLLTFSILSCFVSLLITAWRYRQGQELPQQPPAGDSVLPQAVVGA